MTEEIGVRSAIPSAQALAVRRRRRVMVFVALVPLVMLLMGASLGIGVTEITWRELVRAVVGRWMVLDAAASERIVEVVWDLRMPRVIVAALAGATLGMTGGLMQSTMRNPLASPYTIGVSASAGFGAALAMVLGLSVGGTGTWAVIANAFAFSLVPAALILLIGSRHGLAGETMVLAGVCVSYLFSSLNTLLHFIADDDALRNAVFWLVGDLTRAAMWQVPYLAAALVSCLVLCVSSARDLNVMQFGDEEGRALGVAVARVKAVAIVGSCAATAAVICFTGAIGFVGLLAPHIARYGVGEDERFRLPASGLVGAALLVAAEIIAKRIAAPVLLPVGAVTAVIGGPVLVYSLLRRGRVMRDG